MGIFDLSKEELDDFIRGVRGVDSERLPPPAPWQDNIPVYLEAVKMFFEVPLLVLLCLINYYLWSDVVWLISKFNF